MIVDSKVDRIGGGVKQCVRMAVFCLCFGVLFWIAGNVFRWKDYADNAWPNQATIEGFYYMKRDTVDVLFLGSSQGVAGFIPQLLYDEYGLRSYNLSTEQQSIILSYYLLKEALKYQKPSVVVVDVLSCFSGYNDRTNMQDGCIRKVIDEMRFSSTKCEAIHNICRVDGGTTDGMTELSFYLWPIRYHDRWTQLNKYDFRFMELYRPFDTKGYWRKDYPNFGAGKPFRTDDSVVAMSMNKYMASYLMDMAKLCEGMHLLLVKTPCLYWNWDVSRHKAIQDFADAEGLPFYDFNVAELYESIGYDYNTDGQCHLALSGAQKVTRKIGEILIENYSVTQVSAPI